MPEYTPSHGVVILAAGASGRLGRPKQLLAHRGETLVRRAARFALETEPHTTIIVLGADADAVFASVADLALRRVECSDWRQGMGASLRAGLAALPARVSGALIVLCDQPALDSAHLHALRAAWRENPYRAAASAYAGRLGAPALLPRLWFADVSSTNGDHGARALLAKRSDQVVAVSNEALREDVDDDEDLHLIET